MYRLWPEPDPAALTDEALTALYAPGDRTLPRVRVNFVTSLDGAVTLDSASAGLSSEGDKRVFGLLRMLCDVLLVGAGTVRAEGYHAVRLDEPRRAWRRAHGLAEYPVPAIVSGRLALDPDSDIFANAPVRPLVLTVGVAPADRRAALAPVADVVDCGEARFDPRAAVKVLVDHGLPQVLCEGGPHLFGELTAADTVDELCLTLAPLLAGPGAGRITAGPASAPHRLPLRHVLGDDGFLLLRYAR